MKILITSPYAAPHVGGIESIVSKEIPALLGDSHEVVLLTSNSSRDGKTQQSEYKGNFTLLRIPVWNILEKRLHISWPFFSPSLLWHLWRNIRWCDMVHVHGHLFMPSPIALIIAKIQKKPSVLSMHGRTVQYHTPWKKALQVLAQQTLARISFKCACAMTTQVESDIPLLKQQVGRNTRIQLILNPLPGSGFYPPTPEQRKNARLALGWNNERIKVLFVGSIRPTKGCDLLLKAGNPDYDIVFCGAANLDYQSRIAAAGMQYLPPRELQDMVNLYHACDIAILPSYSESTPLVVTEALQCNKPIILARYQGSEIFERNDFSQIYFCDHTPESIINTIKRTIREGLGNRDISDKIIDDNALKTLFPSSEAWVKTVVSLVMKTPQDAAQ
jgi:glycosyltransferase involved in cell wall biosynthesis